MITAYKFLSEHPAYEGFEMESIKLDVVRIMIEFAKLHVEACKKEYLKCGFGRYSEHAFDKYPVRVSIDEDSILNAYSLENIK